MNGGIRLPPGVEAVLFDLGGVIIDIDWQPMFQHWARHSPLSAAEMAARFAMDAPYAEHERGRLDATDYFAHLREVMCYDGSEAEMIAGWNSIFTGEIKATVGLVRRIRHDVPCYLLTNTNPTHEAAWRRDYASAIGLFGEVFVSSSIGHRKPDRAAFEVVADSTGIAPERFLFLDDTNENVVGARAAGLAAAHVTTPEAVWAALGIPARRKP